MEEKSGPDLGALIIEGMKDHTKYDSPKCCPLFPQVLEIAFLGVQFKMLANGWSPPPFSMLMVAALPKYVYVPGPGIIYILMTF